MKVENSRQELPDSSFGRVRPGRLFFTPASKAICMKGKDGVGRSMAINMETGEVWYPMDIIDVVIIDPDRCSMRVW